MRSPSTRSPEIYNRIFAAESHTAAGTISGGGLISAVVTSKHVSTGQISGGGGVSAVVAGTHDTSGQVSSGGNITAAASGSEGHTTSAVISGGGSLTSAVTGVHDVSTTLSGGGSITASVTHTEHASTSATLSGGGSITATVTGIHVATYGISGGGSITATVDHIESGTTSGTISGGGNISAGCYEISKAGITATSYRTKWGLPEYTINGNIVEASDNRHRNETSGTTWIQWDLGAPYVLNGFDFYNMASPYGLTGNTAMYLSNVFDFSEQIRVVDFNTSYGVNTFDNPFYLYGTTTPVTDAYQYVRMPSPNWGMVEITFYTCGTIGNHNTSGAISGGGTITATVEKPSDGSTSGTISGGGDITHTVIGRHETRAFPDLGEGLMGPGISSGGNITAVVTDELRANISGGGGITPASTGHHTTSGSISGGGGLTTPRAVAAEISGGGGITADGSFTKRYKPGGAAKPRRIGGRAKAQGGAGRVKSGLGPGTVKPSGGAGKAKG